MKMLGRTRLGSHGRRCTSTRATEAKRDWRAITGATYGVRVAADWRPDGWLADFDHMTVQQAEAAVTTMRDGLNAMHRVQAVSESDAAKANDAEKIIPVLAKRMVELEEQRRFKAGELAGIPLDMLLTEMKATQRDIDASKSELDAQHQCPHCNGALAIVGGKVSIPRLAQDIQTDIDRMVEVNAGHAVRLAELQKQSTPLNEAIQGIDREINERRMEHTNAIRDARNAGTVQTAADAAALAQAEQAVEDAKEVVRLVAAEFNAGKLHETVVRYTEIAKALGPEGVQGEDACGRAEET